MSVSLSPDSEVLGEDKVVVNVLLNCEQTKSSEAKQVHFKSLPTTPLEIKKKIEEEFSIPSCVQTLHYQSMTLKEPDELQRTHFRSGDTFTVVYPIEAECEMVRNVIKWLNELFELLRSVEENLPGEENDLLMSSNLRQINNLILEGDITAALSWNLFLPWQVKKMLMNCFHFYHEGGLDVLMKVYGVLVSKEWGDLGIDNKVHIYLERICCWSICSYAQTFPLRRQVVQLDGLDMCTKTLLRKQVRRSGGCDIISDSLLKNCIESALYVVSNLSELPECQVPLAMRTDIIDQALGIALHPGYDCRTAIVSTCMILFITHSPEAHAYIARKEVVEDMLEMCELKHKMVNEPSSLSQQEVKEEPIAVNALKLYTSMVLAQIGLASSHLLFDCISYHLQHQILILMSDVLEATSPAEIRTYEEKLVASLEYVPTLFEVFVQAFNNQKYNSRKFRWRRY